MDRSDQRMLVVNDDVTIRRLIEANLLSLGNDVDTAPNGFRAAAMMRENRYNLVILNPQTTDKPDMRGYERMRFPDADAFGRISEYLEFYRPWRDA